MSRVAAFFDLDRTLIDVNSAILWARAERRDGNLSLLQLVKVLYWAGLYHFSLVNAESTADMALAHYRNRSMLDLEHRTRNWFHREIRHRLRPGARRTLDWHQKAGHLLVLLTTSFHQAAREAAETWGFDAWIANRPLEDGQGRMSGACEKPFCYGVGKVARAEKWAENHRVDLQESYFYSDSYTDLPMLERVGNPRVVAPDPRLLRLARSRGWPVLSW
jgi:HAD superfamily hydrolase (TIGR01490 family)